MNLEEKRCTACGWLLCKITPETKGKIEIKCKQCKLIETFVLED